MKFNFADFKVKDRDVLCSLVSWLDRYNVQRYESLLLNVFVDASGDFCACEFVNRPFRFCSHSHLLIESLCSPYVPLVMPFWFFRKTVSEIASKK